MLHDAMWVTFTETRCNHRTSCVGAGGSYWSSTFSASFLVALDALLVHEKGVEFETAS